MFHHVTIRVADVAASRAFYETTLTAAGIERHSGGSDLPEWQDFSIQQATDERPASSGVHVGFSVASRDAVHAFWDAGIEAGATSDGEPGPRPQYTDDYYGGFLLDPDGNSAEAVHHAEVRRDGNVDHVWIRVADLEASRRFYELVAPYGSFRFKDEFEEGIAWFATDLAGGGDFSVVNGPPSRNVHLAFPGDSRATVDRFHAAAIDAGYEDDGAPGERPEYHPGYHGAFVLDPDGNNVEVVHHGGD